MGAFVKKWFHLVLIFVFAYLAGSLAGQAANQFSSAEESTKNAVYKPSQKPVALTENGIPIYSASADGNWGLSFPNPGQAPVGNTTNDYLKQFNACYMGDPGEKVIYLTFDAGYENGNTAKILDALKKHGVHAAFFVVGNYLETSPELVKRMVEEGHIVGNHTYHHPDMSKISDKASFEKELKDALMDNVQNFLMELGTGFAFVGREYRLQVGNTEQYIDMLFYNIKRHCYVVVEVKVVEFEPGFISQTATYVSAVNHILKGEGDTQTIGLLICKTKDNILAKYAVETSTEPIGISEYELNALMPKDFKGTLPTIEELEQGLSEDTVS